LTEAQAVSWQEPVGVLADLLTSSRVRAGALEQGAGKLFRQAEMMAAPPSFAGALRSSVVSLVCEIKRSSPSKGVIAADLDLSSRVRAYEAGGASALSILTEPRRFGGSLADLQLAGETVGLPLLRKDFIVSELQLAEARVHGASAALLIARALPPARLIQLAHAAADLGLDALVEVRDEQELSSALESGAPVIGVNTRNLETLEIDPAVAHLLIPQIPADRIAVYESGISTREDVESAAATGADAVLVGSSLSASRDAEGAVRGLAGVSVGSVRRRAST